MADTEKQVVIDAILLIQAAVAANLYTGIAYGIFLAVYLISIRMLVSKGFLFRSLEHRFLFGITTIIFIFCTTGIVLGPALTSQDIPTMIQTIDPSFDGVWSQYKTDVVITIIGVVTRFNPFLSDMVCAWRAMVLWKYDRRVVAILSICLLGTFAACIYDLYFAFTQGDQSGYKAKIAVIFAGPVLVTNILSTSLIAWKAWDYHQTLSAHFRKGRHFGRAQKVLMLLIESGFIYFAFWVIFLLNSFSVLPISDSDTYIVTIVMLCISSTYPVSINVLAATTQPYESSEVWVQSVKLVES